MQTILITGADGFIATALSKTLLDADYKLVGATVNAGQIGGYEQVFPGRLGQPLPDEIFTKYKIDGLIHTANFIGRNEYEMNVDGTTQWAEQAKTKGIVKQLFLSSISAKENATSAYGKAKYDLERWFLKNNGIILRLGLVIGEGGMFGRMIQTVKKYPVLPLLDNGKAAVHYTDLQFLCFVVKAVLEDPQAGRVPLVFNLHQPTPTTLYEALKAIKCTFQTFCLFLPVPSWIVLAAVSLLEKMPLLKLNVNSNNIRGLRQNVQLSHQSDCSRFDYPCLSFKELVERL